MRITWPIRILLALLPTACGPGGGRDDGETSSTQSATGSSTGGATGTGGAATDGSSGAPTTSGIVGETGTTSTGGTGDASTANIGSSGSGSSGTGSTGEPKFDLPVPEDVPIPVHDIPGLESITFYETTGQITEYTFTIAGPELNNQLADPLSMDNRDIQGTSVEFYDVYYSEEDGTFNPDGSYLTIAGSFGAKLPAGGGLNLAEISLNYADDTVEYGSYLASFLGLGDNYAPGSEPNAIDGDLATHTTMGNNVDEPDKRLRVTLGFKSSLMPG